MVNSAHRQSQELSARAALLMKSGDKEQARRLFLQAAMLEEEALRQVSVARPRTRGILAVSLVSQYYKAGAYAEAERAAHAYLAQPDLPAFAREQLRELLEAIWDEHALRESGLESVGDSLLVSIRGPGIGAGAAPLGLVADKLKGLQSLLYRIAEWRGDYTFRTMKPPPEDIVAICRPVITEPARGSFRFGMRFQREIQPELIPTRKVDAQELPGWLIRLVQAASPSNFEEVSRQRMEELVPNRQYRHAILRLIRNITPDGKIVKEMEFTSGGQSPERALLHEGTRYHIDSILRTEVPGNMPLHHQIEELQGVLRAVHLDQDWLEITLLPGKISQRCQFAHEVLDDVVGPMVNRRVRARGRWGPGRTEFHLLDIELDTSADQIASGV